jgi:hypothetical protein
LLAQGRWFSPGTPASSTTKTGRHDIAEILLKVALKHQKSNQSFNQSIEFSIFPTSDKPALNFHILPNSLYIIIKLDAVYRKNQHLHFYFFLSQIIT